MNQPEFWIFIDVENIVVGTTVSTNFIRIYKLYAK